MKLEDTIETEWNAVANNDLVSYGGAVNLSQDLAGDKWDEEIENDVYVSLFDISKQAFTQGFIRGIAAMKGGAV